MANFQKIIDAGGTAFPVSQEVEGGEIFNCTGMTLRDYFASQFIASVAQTLHHETIIFYDKIASDAYSMADAMLVERLK
jgi:hypothetical protein